MNRLVRMLAGSALFVAAPALAQSSSLGAAVQAGRAGERYDGYMGSVAAPSDELRRQIAAINIRRRNLYIELASRRGITPDLVGLATACELFAQLAPGEGYMLEDRVWRRRAPGAPAPVPNHCR